MTWVYTEPANKADRGSWRVSGYADVLGALTNHDLLVPGAVQTSEPAGVRREHVVGGDERVRVREQLEARAVELFASARHDALVGNRVDLVTRVANALGLHASAILLDMPMARVHSVRADTHVIWHDAAMARAPGASNEALQATSRLAYAFGVEQVHKVQAIVALMHSLPALLGNVCVHLLHHPVSADEWQQHPRQIVEELMRLAGPARLLYRIVGDSAKAGVNGVRRGDLVAIDIASANNDAAVFPNPSTRDLSRGATPHVAFGWTPHACLGAGAIRLALHGVLGAWMTTFGALPTGWTWHAHEDETLVTMRRMQSVDVTCV